MGIKNENNGKNLQKEEEKRLQKKENSHWIPGDQIYSPKGVLCSDLRGRLHISVKLRGSHFLVLHCI